MTEGAGQEQSKGDGVASRREKSPAAYRDPIVECFKKDVDRTLLRENLKLTVEERIRKAESMHRSIENWRGAARRPRE